MFRLLLTRATKSRSVTQYLAMSDALSLHTQFVLLDEYLGGDHFAPSKFCWKKRRLGDFLVYDSVPTTSAATTEIDSPDVVLIVIGVVDEDRLFMGPTGKWHLSL